MNNSIFNPILANSEINYQDMPFNPEVLEGVRIALSHMIGQDKVTGKFHLLNVDENGNLQITIDQGGGSVITSSQTTVTTTATQLLVTSTSRKRYTLFNGGGINLYIGGSNGVTTANGFIIPPNVARDFVGYSGQLWGIVGGGSCLAYGMEFI